MDEQYSLDYEKIKTAFLEELTKASLGKPSSVSYIKHYLPKNPIITHGIIQGIVIGGTNYIFSTVEIAKDGKRTTLAYETGKLRAFKTRQDLSDFLSIHLDGHADAVGFNFGFPLIPSIGPFGELDAKLFRGSKEHVFAGLTESVGTLVRSIFHTKYNKTIPVAVANDTICLVLAGSDDTDDALILGSGFNIALTIIEGETRTIVSLESNNFDKFKGPNELEYIDEKSDNRGTGRFQKIVSGTYLPMNFNEIIRERKLPLSPITSSEELTRLASEDTSLAGTLARELLNRSASLIAAQVAGIYEFKNRPQRLCFITEGSVFWKGWNYHNNVQKRLLELDVPKNTVVFKKIQDGSIKGAIGLLTL